MAKERTRTSAAWALAAAAVVLVACNSQSQAGRSPTVRSDSTPIATPYTRGGTPSLAGPVQIAQVTASTSDAVIFLQNVGAGGSSDTAAVDISDWKLEVGSTTATALPVPTPGTNQTLFLGPSGNQLSQAMQPGTQVLLVDSRGTIMSQGVVPGGQ